MLIATSLVLAACGAGGSGVPGVASTGTSTTAGKTSSATPTRSSLVAYAQCMRAHGIKDFPEPSGEGFAINGGPGSDLNPNNPQYKSSNSACKSLLPVHTVSAAQQARVQEHALKLAKCMRSHGVPNYPDPKISISGSGVTQSEGAGSGSSGVDPNSPQFKAAQEACQGAPPASSSSGGSGEHE